MNSQENEHSGRLPLTLSLSQMMMIGKRKSEEVVSERLCVPVIYVERKIIVIATTSRINEDQADVDD